jgi:predicted nucleic acid-binding protein
VVVSEFVLVELYRLLRNAAVVSRPLSAPEAAAVVARWRAHPSWRVVGEPEGASIYQPLWQIAGRAGFASRRIFDVRLALSLQAAGVREFATANVRDFADLGFERVWNPLEEGAFP